MGFVTEFNWALKLSLKNGLDEKGLKVGKAYQFKKDECRTYPIDIPIDLLNKNWEAVAKVVVLNYSCTSDRTTGEYQVLKLYLGKEREFLTNYWHETVQIMKGKKIKDFSKVNVT